MKKIIEVNNIVKKYGDKLIIDGISFTIYQGNFVSIIGPNGCGKTTLVNMISNLEELSSGEIKKINNVKIRFVFQHYKESLLPWRTVFDNIKLPLEFSNKKKEIITEKVKQIINEFELNEHKKKYPFQLSGGLAQLTAIARSLINELDILILDEPFKSLDFDVAQHVIKLVLNYCEKKNITTILISHDVEQAILFADRLIVLSKSPTKVKRIFDIKLPRPRKLNCLQSQTFFNEKKKVLEEFQR